MEIKKIFEENKAIFISVIVFFISLIVLGSLLLFILSNNRDNPITSFFSQSNNFSVFNANTSVNVEEVKNKMTPTSEQNTNNNDPKYSYNLNFSFKSKKNQCPI